jgi:hypothetical protein
MSNFPLMYPHAAALGLRVIDAGPGFDELEVEAKLGQERFQKLMDGVKEVFCCGHAHYGKEFPEVNPNSQAEAASHRLRGYERHCIYARDLEAFLSQEGK